MQAKELDNSRAVPPASDLRLAAERLERVALWLREQAERLDPSGEEGTALVSTFVDAGALERAELDAGPPLEPDGDNDG